MIYYDDYSDVPHETVDAFVGTMEMGRLVTVSVGDAPHIGLYPFVYEVSRSSSTSTGPMNNSPISRLVGSVCSKWTKCWA